MKYIIRFFVSIPMICIGISSVFALIYAFEYPLFSLLAIGDLWGFIWISHYFELMVDETCDFLRDLCDKTYIYRS